MKQQLYNETTENVSLLSEGNLYVRLMTSRLFAPMVLVAVLVWEIAALSIKASREPFWYDELLTFHLSSLQPLSLWRALQTSVDGMPAGYYAIVKLARMLPGDPHVTLRLPSILGYILTLIGVYWFPQKRGAVIPGLVAVLLIALSPFRTFALEARSYALLVGFLAISLCLWQRVDEKRYITALLALFLSFAVSCHHLAVVALGCFGLAELTWTLVSRRVRGGVWGAFILASCPFILSVPLVLRYRQIFGNTFWARSQWWAVASTYRGYLGLNFPLAIALTALLVVGLIASVLRSFRERGHDTQKHNIELPEMVLVGGFVLYPACLAILTKLMNSGYADRYGWPGVLGLVLGLIYLSRPTWMASVRTLVAFLIAFAAQGVLDYHTLPSTGPIGVEARWSALDALCQNEPDIPVVIGSGTAYLVAVQYSPVRLRNRLVHVDDLDEANRLNGSDTVDRTNLLLSGFVPLRIERLAPFEAAHRRFILYSGGGSFDWFTKHLLLEKTPHLTLLSQEGGGSVYLVEM